MGAGAQAEDSPVIVDEPLVCETISDIEKAVQYYVEGGFSLAKAWVEYSPGCVELEKTTVPDESIQKFVILVRGDQINYGYVPVVVDDKIVLMFFMTIRPSGDIRA
mgnify:CR=1